MRVAENARVWSVPEIAGAVADCRCFAQVSVHVAIKKHEAQFLPIVVKELVPSRVCR